MNPDNTVNNFVTNSLLMSALTSLQSPHAMNGMLRGMPYSIAPSNNRVDASDFITSNYEVRRSPQMQTFTPVWNSPIGE